jgi:hypothetical protein
MVHLIENAAMPWHKTFSFEADHNRKYQGQRFRIDFDRRRLE